jgi:hypothetical protein
MSYHDRFDRELIIYLDRAMLMGIAEFERGEMTMFICDELHKEELFGPRTFIVIRESDHSQFDIRGGAPIPQATDDAAWERVVHYVRNAHLASRDE